MKTFVFNGWAADCETWAHCKFPRDRIFDYLEQMDGQPERAMEGTDSALLVGFSMGGATALRLFLAYPEKVCGLVLISTTPRIREDPSTGWRGLSDRRRAALLLGARLAHRGNPSPLFDDANLERGLDSLDAHDLRDALRNSGPHARFPVRIFQSARDGIVYSHNADFLQQIFPQAVVSLVPGNEHTLPPVIPEQIDAAVREITCPAMR